MNVTLAPRGPLFDLGSADSEVLELFAISEEIEYEDFHLVQPLLLIGGTAAEPYSRRNKRAIRRVVRPLARVGAIIDTRASALHFLRAWRDPNG